MRRIAVRKILKVRRLTSVLKRVAIASFAFASVGIFLYLTLLPYEVVILDAFLWVLEALLFTGVVITLNVVTSRTLYSARYELLRGESLTSLFIALIAIIISIHILASSVGAILDYKHLSLSNPLSTTYVFASAAFSVLVYEWCQGVTRTARVRALIADTLSRKQLLDAVIDFALGVSVLVANIVNEPLIEVSGIILVTTYVLKGYLEMVKENVVGLIGISESVDIKEKIINVIRSNSRLRVRKVTLMTLGSFVEAEVWIEVPPSTTLGEAHEIALRVARTVISRVPEVIRALVITVPSSKEVRVRPLQISRSSTLNRLTRIAKTRSAGTYPSSLGKG